MAIVEVGFGDRGAAAEAVRKLLELSVDDAGYERAELLALDLRIDAGVFPVPHDHLELVDVVRAPAERGLDRQLETVREAGLCAEPLPLGTILLLDPPALR